MNTMTARALIIGVLIAAWAWLAGVARLQVSLWAGIVALGCFFAAGGGVLGLQKTVVALFSGVVWVLVANAVRVAVGVGPHSAVWALILGAAAVGLMLQSRLPFLSFTAGAFAGAGVALGLGVNGVNSVYDAIRAGVSLAVGALIGFAAERVAGSIPTRRA